MERAGVDGDDGPATRGIAACGAGGIATARRRVSDVIGKRGCSAIDKQRSRSAGGIASRATGAGSAGCIGELVDLAGQ